VEALPGVHRKGLQPETLHSALGYLPPAEFEAQLMARNLEAAAPQLVFF